MLEDTESKPVIATGTDIGPAVTARLALDGDERYCCRPGPVSASQAVYEFLTYWTHVECKVAVSKLRSRIVANIQSGISVAKPKLGGSRRWLIEYDSFGHVPAK